ncbi:MAG: DUF2098 domain-containing protein [Methanomicrobiaceae archaeon]|nr:DUF2098 domain-containing protein [Methanomicrobiaceae archaeon]
MEDGDISPGTTVRYPRTGTTGTVVRIEDIDGNLFAELDSTHLLYRIDQLHVLGKGKHAGRRKEDRAGQKPLSLDEALSAEEIQEGIAGVDGVGAG